MMTWLFELVIYEFNGNVSLYKHPFIKEDLSLLAVYCLFCGWKAWKRLQIRVLWLIIFVEHISIVYVAIYLKFIIIYNINNINFNFHHHFFYISKLNSISIYKSIGFHSQKYIQQVRLSSTQRILAVLLGKTVFRLCSRLSSDASNFDCLTSSPLRVSIVL